MSSVRREKKVFYKEIEYFNPIRKKRENNLYQFCLDFILNYIWIAWEMERSYN